MFVDEFLEFTSNTLPSHTNNIYIGDFNLHLSDEADTDSAIFRDATEAMVSISMWHSQLINQETHWTWF